MSHFPDSLAAMSGFAMSLGAIVGPVTLEDAINCSGYLVLGAGFVGWTVREEHIMMTVDVLPPSSRESLHDGCIEGCAVQTVSKFVFSNSSQALTSSALNLTHRESSRSVSLSRCQGVPVETSTESMHCG